LRATGSCSPGRKEEQNTERPTPELGDSQPIDLLVTPSYIQILDAAPNAVVGVDANGRIMYANPLTEATFGFNREELLGRPIEALMPADARNRHLAFREGFLSAPSARPMGIGMYLSAQRRDGSQFPVEISLAPIRLEGKQVIFATVIDITARKAAEDQLLQARKLESLGRLAGGIAHDFNNMLFAIRGHAEMLKQDLSADNRAAFDFETSMHGVEAIRLAAEGATKLTSQLLAFARQQVVRPEILDVNQAIEAMQPMIRRLINADIQLTHRLDPSTGLIRTDPGQLDQILVNLIVNARDAMPHGGTITIETGNIKVDEPYAADLLDVTPGPYVLIAVSDTGSGMDRATREHVFEPFFTTKAPGKGTGLGLATIHGIVKQAGGHIWLYSEPGLGTTFKICFPRMDAQQTVAPADPLPAPAVGVGTVLVVEDEPSVRETTTELLKRAGYRVLAVVDGAQAIIAVENATESIDVIVSDVVMPTMSGIALSEHMMDRHPEIGLVLLSGYTAGMLEIERIIARGAIFVSKPVTSDALILAIQAAGRSKAADR
jgi:two-component system cell cycle sensor histidine kinase/response regulator CckA